jgi:hypothetical protein
MDTFLTAFRATEKKRISTKYVAKDKGAKVGGVCYTYTYASFEK